MRLITLPFADLPHGVYELVPWVDGRTPGASKWWCTRHGWCQGPVCRLCGPAHGAVEHVEQSPWNNVA